MKKRIDFLEIRNYSKDIRFLNSKKGGDTVNMNDRIRRHIKANGMTFTSVAEKAGYDVKKFSRWMSNKQKLSVDEYEQICVKGLNVDPCIFFKEKFLEIKNLTA